MKVLVFVEIGADVRVPPARDPRSGRVRREWLVREADPACTRALDLALNIKSSRTGTEVAAIHLGPAENEPWLRKALARGCDWAVRVWDPEVAEVRAPGKAVVLGAVAQATGFDTILAGASGVFASSGQFGVLLAAHLGVPAVTQVIEAAFRGDARTAEVTRGLDRGYRERVEVRLPAVLTVTAGPAAADAAPAPAIPVAGLLAAQRAEIPVWDLADLGVPLDYVRRADQALRAGVPRPVRPRHHPLAAPDPNLPAFERILKLVQGAVQRREGRVVRKPAGEVVEEVFRSLKDEGWLDHLRAGEKSEAGRLDAAASAPDGGARGAGAGDER